MNQVVKATATLESGEKQPVQVEYDFGDNLAHAVEMFTEDIVFSIFRRQAVIALQDVIRVAKRSGKTDEEIAAMAATWKPSKSVKGDPVDKLVKKMQTPDQIKATIDKLKAMLKQQQ